MPRRDGKELLIPEGYWAAYRRGGPQNNGPWEFMDTFTADHADLAARLAVVSMWASGTHAVLVVSPTEAAEFHVTVEVEEVTDD